jgi:hypothetical protein
MNRAGSLAAGLGSLVGFGLAGAGVTAALTEGDASTFITYVTGDPHGLLELEGLAIFVALAAASVGAPVGCIVALLWRGYGRAGATGAATMSLIAGFVIALIALQALEPPVMPWGMLLLSFAAGLAGRTLVQALSTQDHEAGSSGFTGRRGRTPPSGSA